MKAPCPHCEHTKIRGNVADVAPMWPQFGQTIRVSISVASAGACARQEQVRNFPHLNACPHSLRAAASDSLAMLAAIRRVVADQEDSTAAQPLSPRYDRNGSGPSSRIERYVVTLPPAPGHSKVGGLGGCCRGLGAGR
jgi:hypothetical protein